MKACKHCGSDGHSSTFCFKAPKKPVNRVSRRKRIVVVDGNKKPVKRAVNKASARIAKKHAWAAFSAYIRLRDCLTTTGTSEEGICVTCEVRYSFKQLQAGHFIGGRNNSVLFSELGVHAQCNACNAKHIGNGKPIEYWLFMEKTYGRETVDRLIAESRMTVKFTASEYLAIELLYKSKIKNMLA